MDLSLTDYRSKVIAKIIHANSQEEVKRYIDTAIKSLEQHKLHGHIISRFADKMLAELELFNPMEKDAQEWSNINMARIVFKQINRSREPALRTDSFAIN